MAGGVGSRLYPLSTPEHPKQFLDLLGTGKTLIQMTCERFLEVDPKAVFWVVTGEAYLHFVQEQLPEVSRARILLEPASRNTAPCISYACRRILKEDPSANVVVTPADAFIPDSKAFASVIHTALSFSACTESLVCIGINPAGPSPLYGYIKAAPFSGPVFKIANFKEKPSVETARGYLREGNYFWNAGIFVWRAAVMASQLRLYAPGIESLMDRIEPSMCSAAEREVLASLFPQCEKISIDYAVMERTELAYVVPFDGVWSDLGSFEAIEEVKGSLTDPR